MRVGSLFSGIGGIDLGLERAGHEVVFQCESDPYRRRVLARHWPGVPCFEDVRMVAQRQRGEGSRSESSARGGIGTESSRNGSMEHHASHAIDLLCGGFPCQDLSVAGRRAGLDGARSGLFFEFARIADALLPDGGWVLIENVPGLLSSHGGRDFAVLLSTLADIGFHDLAWRVLDSRYFGVPQRRRRVFILARRARGRCASEVLLEPESGGGNFEAGRETGPRVAASLSKGSSNPGVSYPGRRKEDDENLHYYVEDFEDGTLTGAGQHGGPPRSDRNPLIAQPLRGASSRGGSPERSDLTLVSTSPNPDRVREAPGLPGRVDDPIGFHATQEPITERDGTPALGSNAYLGVSTSPNPDRDGEAPALPGRVDGGMTAQSITRGDARHPSGREVGNLVASFRGETADRCALDPKPDGPRYAACGDAVTVNVAQWIGERLRDFG